MTDIEYIKKYYEGNIDDALNRLSNGEPVQYIVGNVDFYGNKLFVNKNVLIPRFETEELVDNAIKIIKKNFKEKINIIDIGTGSGAISISLKKELNCNITATDISKEALEVAKINAKYNGVEINFVNTNLFDNIDDKFDVVISNPPYIAFDEKIEEIVKNNEPHIALYAANDGLYFYEEILKNINRIINKRYLIAFEIGMNQADKIKKLANKYLNNCNIEVKKDIQERDRMVFIYNFE